MSPVASTPSTGPNMTRTASSAPKDFLSVLDFDAGELRLLPLAPRAGDGQEHLGARLLEHDLAPLEGELGVERQENAAAARACA